MTASLTGMVSALSKTVVSTGATDAEYTVTYTAGVPGQYIVDIQVLDQSTNAMVTVGVTGAPLVLTFTSNPSPVMTLAVLQDSLGFIDVFFDRATDQAGITGVGSCSNLLNNATIAKLGNMATCSWEQTATETYSHLKVGNTHISGHNSLLNEA